MSSYVTSPFVLEERRLQGIADQCRRDFYLALDQVKGQEEKIRELAERQEESDRNYLRERERAVLWQEKEQAQSFERDKEKKAEIKKRLENTDAELAVYEKRYGSMERALLRQERLWLQLENTVSDFEEIERRIGEQEKEIGEEIQRISAERAAETSRHFHAKGKAGGFLEKGVSLQTAPEEKAAGHMPDSPVKIFEERLQRALTSPFAGKYPSLAALKEQYDREPDHAKTAFAVKNRRHLEKLEEQLEGLLALERREQEKRKETAAQYRAVCRLLGTEPDEELIADGKADRALAGRYHDLYREYEEKKRREYVSAAIASVMEKHGIFYQDSAGDGGRMHFEMEDAQLDISGVESGHLSMEVSGEYAGEKPAWNDKRKAVLAAGRFCVLLAEIEEELKTDHGIVFSRVLTQKPDEETIVMRKRHSAGHQRGGYGAGKERLADRQG